MLPIAVDCTPVIANILLYPEFVIAEGQTLCGAKRFIPPVVTTSVTLRRVNGRVSFGSKTGRGAVSASVWIPFCRSKVLGTVTVQIKRGAYISQNFVVPCRRTI